MLRFISQSSRVIFLILLMVAAPKTIWGKDFPFTSDVFSADEGCRWMAPPPPGLQMSAHFIYGPSPEQDHSAWFSAMQQYRAQLHQATQSKVIDMRFDGVRAWVRLKQPFAQALKIAPGQKISLRIEARWLEGGNQLCFALDQRDPQAFTWKGWTGVLNQVEVPKTGNWEVCEVSITCPDLKDLHGIFQPIIGMDETHDSHPAHLEIRNIQVQTGQVSLSSLPELSQLAYESVQASHLIHRSDLRWASTTHTCRMVMVWDEDFYDRELGTYTLEKILDDGEREYGGDDILVLWQGYPRLGFDERNQFDMYRDLPGGLAALRQVVHQAQQRGVKIFIDYNPWDSGTRREPQSDEVVLAELVEALDADGIFLDTLPGTSLKLREEVDKRRKGVVFMPEIHPPLDQLSLCHGSWAQYLEFPPSPGLLHLKWVEPSHVQFQTRRWDNSHAGEIETAFFNGSGFLVWENIFGTYNPLSQEDRRLWKRCNAILTHFSDLFTGSDWVPFFPPAQKGISVQKWAHSGSTIFTLINTGEPIQDQPLLELPYLPDRFYLDLWNGKRLREEPSGPVTRIKGSIQKIGCILSLPASQADESLHNFLEQQRFLANLPPEPDRRNFALSVVDPLPVDRTHKRSKSHPPQGMVPVPGTSFHMKLHHMRRECGTYPNPGTPREKWKDFLWGSPFEEILDRDLGTINIQPFFIDEAEVSNSDFKKFLDASGYQPRDSTNFLKHWPMREFPHHLADHPVVYIDLEDARAYAHWAGKRLPTEPEWQLAAQGTDGRLWPWGNDFDPARCTSDSGGTLPVRSLPEGRSPFGCYHMSGNVWEWTESERDDGHIRFAILRGGSYFKPEGSIWYAPGGPLACTDHAKFLLMDSSIDRCSTIGFRCVVDSE